MKFLVDGRFTPGIDRTPLLADERRKVRELKEEGLVERAFRRADGTGAYLICDAPDRVTVETAIASLPFVELGMMSVEIHEIESLDFIWTQ